VRESVGHVRVASGWYPDPARPGTERYWDGSGWTDERPVPVADPSEVMRTAPLRSTVGFELPSYEALAEMRAGAGTGGTTEKPRRAWGRRRASGR
jgi:hypothetical protein